MSDVLTSDAQSSWLTSFLADDRFFPVEPASLEEAGVSVSLIESLICKQLAIVGSASGRSLANVLGLPFRLLSDVYSELRMRQVVVHSGSAPFNDFYYVLTEEGQRRAEVFRRACAYVGAVPVALRDYILSVEAQCISTESPGDEALRHACKDISYDEELLDLIGPAVNSGAGMFLYGAPGNGKSTLAKRITMCFGQHIWIPQAIVVDGQVIKLYDSSCHQEVGQESQGIVRPQAYDQRWVKIVRPTVSVGGELTMDNLELRFDATTNVSEAPLQMKSNAGCLVIDDFGRQRVEPAELLNRWIVPLENGCDYLTLINGKKICVPFEQLIIFSTNLEPRDLVDEAFLRRIPYKVELLDPSEEEFRRLFVMYADKFGCSYDEHAVDHLIQSHYHVRKRAMRRCHPRDLLRQIRNFCRYRRIPFEMRPEYFDRVARSYFAMVLGDSPEPKCANPNRMRTATPRSAWTSASPPAPVNGIGSSDH